jgi:small subunit ribosomal protein S16
MALKIRFRLQGRKNRQTFRLVLTDSRNPRDGKYLETLGSYDPFKAEGNFALNADRIRYWLDQGAVVSDNAQKLIGKAAPDVVAGMRTKLHAKKLKMAAKRRAAKKK